MGTNKKGKGIFENEKTEIKTENPRKLAKCFGGRRELTRLNTLKMERSSTTIKLVSPMYTEGLRSSSSEGASQGNIIFVPGQPGPLPGTGECVWEQE